MITQGPGAAGVGDPSSNTEHTDHENRPAANGDQIKTNQYGGAKTQDHGQAHLSGRGEPALSNSERPQALAGIRAFFKVKQIIRQVGANLNEHRGYQSAKKRQQNESAIMDASGGPHQ